MALTLVQVALLLALALPHRQISRLLELVVSHGRLALALRLAHDHCVALLVLRVAAGAPSAGPPLPAGYALGALRGGAPHGLRLLRLFSDDRVQASEAFCATRTPRRARRGVVRGPGAALLLPPFRAAARVRLRISSFLA